LFTFSSIIKEFKASRTAYLDHPSSHPDHAKEWKLFWEKKDPDTHKNYHREWCEYWIKKMLTLLKDDAEKKM
jgi:hypothetical protein